MTPNKKLDKVRSTEEALKRIASELRYYNPVADKYKGEFIHKVWAKEIDELLAQQSNEQVEPVAKKWLLHGSFADVASFDTEGFPSFYSKESFTKFKNGELSAPCKGKNCGSLNGWLHSAECRAEHESHYTHPPVPTAQPKEPEQEPVAWIHNFIEGGVSIGKRPIDLDRHPDRWTALYKYPEPCPTCEALARTVMLDQTSHDTTPPPVAEPHKRTAAVGEDTRRAWVGLNDDDKKQIAKAANYNFEMTTGEYAERIGRLTEAKLKEKNT